jgi:hypothetical protein
MRWCRIAFAAVMIATMTVHATLGQTPERDPIRIPPNGQPLRIERADDIPRQLNAAIKRSECRLDAELMRAFPIEVFSPGPSSYTMALVTCAWIAGYGRAFIFENGVGREPTLMRFPLLSRPQGFTASEHPGTMSWSPETKTIIATERNDLCGAVITRHTYRHQAAEGLNGFALVRVEQARPEVCDGRTPDWTVIWEAPQWDLAR